MGSAALALLLDRIQGLPTRSRRLRPELVARASTLGDPVPTPS
jgi:DNA-binding LacI/PurR family transcriptional regulator